MRHNTHLLLSASAHGDPRSHNDQEWSQPQTSSAGPWSVDDTGELQVLTAFLSKFTLLQGRLNEFLFERAGLQVEYFSAANTIWDEATAAACLQLMQRREFTSQASKSNTASEGVSRRGISPSLHQESGQQFEFILRPHPREESPLPIIDREPLSVGSVLSTRFDAQQKQFEDDKLLAYEMHSMPAHLREWFGIPPEIHEMIVDFARPAQFANRTTRSFSFYFHARRSDMGRSMYQLQAMEALFEQHLIVNRRYAAPVETDIAIPKELQEVVNGGGTHPYIHALKALIKREPVDRRLATVLERMRIQTTYPYDDNHFRHNVTKALVLETGPSGGEEKTTFVFRTPKEAMPATFSVDHEGELSLPIIRDSDPFVVYLKPLE